MICISLHSMKSRISYNYIPLPFFTFSASSENEINYTMGWVWVTTTPIIVASLWTGKWVQYSSWKPLLKQDSTDWLFLSLVFLLSFTVLFISCCVGKYIGNRPMKLRKSVWKERCFEVVKKKEKEKKRLGFR